VTQLLDGGSRKYGAPRSWIGGKKKKKKKGGHSYRKGDSSALLAGDVSGKPRTGFSRLIHAPFSDTEGRADEILAEEFAQRLRCEIGGSPIALAAR